MQSLSSPRGFGIRPQLSKTGVTLTEDRLQIGLDWYSATFPGCVLPHIRETVEQIFADKFTDRDYGLSWYKSRADSVHGITLGWDYRGFGQPHGLIDIPAHCLRMLSLPQLFRLLLAFDELGCRLSRGDIALDDYSKGYSPADAYRAWENGNISGFRLHTGRYQQSGKPDDPACTFSLGKRGKNGGGKYLRIYDKSKQSKGEFDCIRCEVAYYGSSAHQLGDAMVEVARTGDQELWVQTLGGWVSGAVRFLDRSVSPNAGRCPNLDWWDELIEDFGRLAPFRQRPIQTLERAKQWISKQVAPTLALVFEVFMTHNPDTQAWNAWLYDQLVAGMGRYNPAQELILQQAKLLTGAA